LDEEDICDDVPVDPGAVCVDVVPVPVVVVPVVVVPVVVVPPAAGHAAPPPLTAKLLD